MATTFLEEVGVLFTDRANPWFERLQRIRTGSYAGTRIDLAIDSGHNDQVVVRYDIGKSGIGTIEFKNNIVAIGLYINDRCQHPFGS